MTQSGTPVRPVGIEELRRAWHAVQEGRFRARQSRAEIPPRSPGEALTVWNPTEPVLPVLGCAGQTGATTIALALATAAGSSRVVECCTATASGLSAASTAELGQGQDDWALGRRSQVWLTRTSRVLLEPGEAAPPDPPLESVSLTVLDVGWEVGQVMASDSWIREQVTTASSLVLASTPTVPALRRLEMALTLLSPAHVVIAIRGPHPRRWPKTLTASLGPLSVDALKTGPVVSIPTDKGLLLRGLDSTPLPTSLLKAAENLLQHIAVGDHHSKGPQS
jgi:hypothetical protein